MIIPSNDQVRYDLKYRKKQIMIEEKLNQMGLLNPTLEQMGVQFAIAPPQSRDKGRPVFSHTTTSTLGPGLFIFLCE